MGSNASTSSGVEEDVWGPDFSCADCSAEEPTEWSRIRSQDGREEQHSQITSDKVLDSAQTEIKWKEVSKTVLESRQTGTAAGKPATQVEGNWDDACSCDCRPEAREQFAVLLSNSGDTKTPVEPPRDRVLDSFEQEQAWNQVKKHMSTHSEAPTAAAGARERQGHESPGLAQIDRPDLSRGLRSKGSHSSPDPRTMDVNLNHRSHVAHAPRGNPAQVGAAVTKRSASSSASSQPLVGLSSPAGFSRSSSAEDLEKLHRAHHRARSPAPAPSLPHRYAPKGREAIRPAVDNQAVRETEHAQFKAWSESKHGVITPNTVERFDEMKRSNGIGTSTSELVSMIRTKEQHVRTIRAAREHGEGTFFNPHPGLSNVVHTKHKGHHRKHDTRVPVDDIDSRTVLEIVNGTTVTDAGVRRVPLRSEVVEAPEDDDRHRPQQQDVFDPEGWRKVQQARLEFQREHLLQ